MGTRAFQSVGHEHQQEEEGFPGRRCAECPPSLAVAALASLLTRSDSAQSIMSIIPMVAIVYGYTLTVRNSLFF